MMRALMMATLLLWVATAQAASRWDALWRTPDQQGERLLNDGHPAQAAHAFQDPRRKAYAELEAGNYATAAKAFAAFHDSDSEYNRGNALARAGKLEAAIKAYDAALASNPNNRDARHNRDLVAKALKKQKPKPQSKNGKAHGKQNGPGKDKGQGQGKGKTSSQGKQNGKGQSGTGHPHTTGKPGDQGSGAGKHANGAGRTGKPQANTSNQSAGRHGLKQNAAEAQAGKKAGGRRHGGAARTRTDMPPRSGKAAQDGRQPSAPLSENQLAQAQWLRRIPDDPGGLLRRKFMIEHMLRQEGKQP